MRARRELKNKAKNLKIKKVYLRNHNRCFHVFAQTTHVVAAPHGFACVGIPTTWLCIPSFIEIRSGVSEPQGVKFAISHYFGYWLLQQLVLPYVRTSRVKMLRGINVVGARTRGPSAVAELLMSVVRVSHVTYILNFGALVISLESVKLCTSNFVC